MEQTLVSAVLWGSMAIALLLFQSIRDIRKLKIHAADIKWFLGLGIVLMVAALSILQVKPKKMRS